MLTKIVNGEVVELTAAEETQVRAGWATVLVVPALQQIRAIESKLEVTDAFARATRQLLLKTWFDRAKAMPAAATFTDAQIEAWCRANDKTYKALAEAEDAIKPLRGQP